MNQTVLIILGVTVFTMTVVGVLIFFYALFDDLAGIPDAPVGDAMPLTPANDDV